MLAAEREPWIAIDAKPMVGDAAYDPMRAAARLANFRGLEKIGLVFG